MEKEKIENAIEYIEKYLEYDEETGVYTKTHTFDKDNLKELYLILKGSK